MAVSWGKFIYHIFRILNFLILARVVLSWVRPKTNGAFLRHFYEFTDLLLMPASWILKQLNLDRGMFDWSPVLTVFLLELLERGIESILW